MDMFTFTEVQSRITELTTQRLFIPNSLEMSKEFFP